MPLPSMNLMTEILPFLNETSDIARRYLTASLNTSEHIQQFLKLARASFLRATTERCSAQNSYRNFNSIQFSLFSLNRPWTLCLGHGFY